MFKKKRHNFVALYRPQVLVLAKMYMKRSHASLKIDVLFSCKFLTHEESIECIEDTSYILHLCSTNTTTNFMKLILKTASSTLIKNFKCTFLPF